MDEAIVVTCRAKLNLTFEVLRRRPDGYHEVRSLMHPVALADRLEITQQPDGITLEVEGLAVSAGRDNLCVQAAEACCDLVGCRSGVHLRLAKHIPPEGGLGGGSADAAGVIAGLSRLLGRPVGEAEHALAARLGSDVPFSLGSGPALAAGRGELLTPVPPAEFWVVIARPDLGISTREAYAMLTPDDWTDGAATDAAADSLRHAAARAPAAAPCPALPHSRGRWGRRPACPAPSPAAAAVRDAVLDLHPVNAFWRTLQALHPELAAIRAALEQAGCPVTGLTGSGSCLFGLAPSEAAAAAAAEAVTGAAAWSWYGPSAAEPLAVSA